MSFKGFSEDDLQKMKFAETGARTDLYLGNSNVKKIDKIGAKPKRAVQQYKSPTLQSHNSDEAIDSIDFDKCKLSLKSPNTPPSIDICDTVVNDEIIENTNIVGTNNIKSQANDINETVLNNTNISKTDISRKNSLNVDGAKCVDNYTEDDLAAHRAKLEELQTKQRLMEEQNKKRKEMLAKALADRTKQTVEEVNRLEKIKKELQVLDGQFSLDVAVLRKKIDQACLSYSEAEKHYLKVEKDFLQAKINLQKEREKKELLTEHLCALITHNETRKAQKLETLMLELASEKHYTYNEPVTPVDDKSMVIDGVDGRTGKMVEMSPVS